MTKKEFPEISKKETMLAGLYYNPYNLEEALLFSEENNLSENKILGSRSDLEFIEIKNGGAGIFKDRSEYEKGDLFINRERAAYLVDSFLGFNFVPPTVIRDIKGKRGSFQQFVTDAKTTYEVKKEEIPKEELMKLDIFDFIIRMRDRSGLNVLVKRNKIYAIDHELAFNTTGGGSDFFFPPHLADVPLPEEVIVGLENFTRSAENQATLRDLLNELLPEKEVEITFRRIHAIQQLISGKGFLSSTDIEVLQIIAKQDKEE